MSQTRKLTPEELKRQINVLNDPIERKIAAELHRLNNNNDPRPVSRGSSLALELRQRGNAADERAIADAIEEDVLMDDIDEEENVVEEKKKEAVSNPNISTLIKQDNKQGKCFAPSQDGKFIAFIQDNLQDKTETVQLWNIAENKLTELKPKISKNDFSKIATLALSADRYLIGVLEPDRTKRRQNNELLVWDLQNQTRDMTSPLTRLVTEIPPEWLCSKAVITEDHTLMGYYERLNESRNDYSFAIATFSLSPEGVLAKKNFFQLVDHMVHRVEISQKGLIFDLWPNNKMLVLNTKGAILSTLYFRGSQGTLLCADKPFVDGDAIWNINMLNHSTLALKIANQSFYIIDITQYNKPKQIGYVDINKLTLRETGSQESVDIIPMNDRLKSVAVHQSATDTICLYDLKENKVVGECKINYHNTTNVRFDDILLNNYDLISSQYERMASGEYFYSISVRKMELLQLHEIIEPIENLLQDQYSFPRDIARLTTAFLIGNHRNQFFSRKRMQPAGNSLEVSLESSESKRHTNDGCSLS